MLKPNSMKILINCSNLHHGGGVAVATSFLSCLCQLHQTENISVLVSSLVHKNLLALGVSAEQFEQYEVKDYFGLESIWKGLDNYFIDADIVFTVFGPAYFLRKRTTHIFGLAQPYIVYPKNVYEQTLPLLSRIKLRVKYALQSFFFARADELIVELDHVKTGLLKQRLFKNIPIHIVNSAVDGIYKNSERWESVALPLNENRLKLGVISKNYPHKNLTCFPAVKEALKKKYSIDADFFVTFSEDEWAECDEHFRQVICNVGPLKLTQCPLFYNALDGVIFPSLLECFSAVPLEAMTMRKPLFASNLPFIVDCCDQYANYVDPMDPEQIAQSIYTYFKRSASDQNEFVNNAYLFSQSYPDANARASSYSEILLKKLNQQ
jgi:glycosyltransferase involved in cell wall biosynthesis